MHVIQHRYVIDVDDHYDGVYPFLMKANDDLYLDAMEVVAYQLNKITILLVEYNVDFFS